MIEALFSEAEALADDSIEEVLRRLLDRLDERPPTRCRKHTYLVAQYTEAALARHRERKRMGIRDMGFILVTDNVTIGSHPAEARWQDFKRQYHQEPCTCRA